MSIARDQRSLILGKMPVTLSENILKILLMQTGLKSKKTRKAAGFLW